MTDAEIAGYMNWTGPGAYTQHHMKRIRRIVEEVQRQETEACASVCDEADKESQSQWPKRLATMIRARSKA
jgi:hypothetical protein